MRDWQGHSHGKWYCKYPIVYRRRAMFGNLRRQTGGIPRDLCVRHGVELVAGHAMGDHIHRCLSISPGSGDF